MKDTLFIDTNVMLDLLGERAPYYDSAAKIASLADNGNINMGVPALSYDTVYYLLSKFESNKIVKEKLRKFKVMAITADLSYTVTNKGLSLNFNDFEDTLQYHCAIKFNCNLLITRNVKDFTKSSIPVMTPDEYLVSLKSKN